ncbi:MAG: ABC transporter permease [Clostridiales bacterium]|jgi:ABC-type dipeptide/oligopeptide/nickel transport system permease subunit|nr:ABC transporter permease [Clostridiales bacterium]
MDASATAAAGAPAMKPVKKQNQLASVMKRLSLNKSAMAGMVIFFIVLFFALFGELLAPYSYVEINPANAFVPPSAEHWFGTDNMGRDVLSRVLVGCKWSLFIGVGAQIIACGGGIVLGCIPGFFGGKVDQVVMRVCDVIQAIPSVLLNITLAGVMGPGIFNTILAMGLGGITGGTRLMRSSIMSVRKKEYLEAASAINCSNPRIIVKHALPNAFAPMIVSFTMSIGSGIIGASALTYLGLGVQAPNPEWGALVTAGRDYIKSAPYLTLIPGFCILIVVLSLNLFGDGLRDALDPKLKK